MVLPLPMPFTFEQAEPEILEKVSGPNLLRGTSRVAFLRANDKQRRSFIPNIPPRIEVGTVHARRNHPRRLVTFQSNPRINFVAIEELASPTPPRIQHYFSLDVSSEDFRLNRIGKKHVLLSDLSLRSTRVQISIRTIRVSLVYDGFDRPP